MMLTESYALALSLSDWFTLSSVIAVIITTASFVLSIRRLKHVPGPWWAAPSRAWLVRVLASGDAVEKFDEVSKEHGKLNDGPSLVKLVSYVQTSR